MKLCIQAINLHHGQTQHSSNICKKNLHFTKKSKFMVIRVESERIIFCCVSHERSKGHYCHALTYCKERCVFGCVCMRVCLCIIAHTRICICIIFIFFLFSSSTSKTIFLSQTVYWCVLTMCVTMTDRCAT